MNWLWYKWRVRVANVIAGWENLVSYLKFDPLNTAIKDEEVNITFLRQPAILKVRLHCFGEDNIFCRNIAIRKRRSKISAEL